MKAVIVANPFPITGGGSYRALKSLLAYPSKGGNCFLLVSLSRSL